MTICNVQFISFVVAGLLALEAGATSPSLEFELSPSQIEPGARARLTLTLNGTRPDTRARINDELLTESKDLTILERSFKLEDDRQIWVIDLTAYKNGSLRVPPLEVIYDDSTFSTENRELKIQSSRPEDDVELRQEFGAVSLPSRWDIWGRVAFWIVALGSVAWFAVRTRRRFKELKSLRLKHFRETEAPQVWLRMRLDYIRQLLEDGADEKQVWAELASAVRGYFSRCSMNPVEAWTTGEFELKLTRYPEARRLLPLLRQWDRRFTREKTPGEITAPDALIQTERILLPWTA